MSMALFASRRFANGIRVDHVPAHNLASDEDQSTVYHHPAPDHHVRPDGRKNKSRAKKIKAKDRLSLKKMKYD